MYKIVFKLIQIDYDALRAHGEETHAQFNADFEAPVTKEAYGEIARFLDAHLAR